MSDGLSLSDPWRRRPQHAPHPIRIAAAIAAAVGAAAGTPPLIQAILQNSGAIFSIPFSIWWLGDKKRYLSAWPLLAALLIVGSVVVSILPTILDGNAGAGVDGGNSVAWCMVYLCGLIPGAAYNVLQQR